MESFLPEPEESTEDVPGRKKSKLKSLKSRLFGRSKRDGEDRNTKLSQSSSDITVGKGLGSDEDLVCPQGMMGSRALSHDSIFLADHAVSEAEPARVLSQENVHSKIKALQMKLQLQKMHLGPPPLVLPIRRPEDQGSHSEDDNLTHSPPEISGGSATQGALNKAISQSSRPLSPILKSTPIKSVSLTTSSSFIPATSSSSSSVVEPPLDLSCPPQFTPCLDTSAARHRMSVKPRKQRASTKGKRYATDSHLHSINNTDHPVSEKEEETAQEEMTHFDSTQILETGQVEANVTISSQCLPLKSLEPAPITSEPSEAEAAPSPIIFHQDHPPPVSTHVLEVKPNRPVDVISSEQTQSNLKEERESPCDFDLQITPETGSLNKSGTTYSKSKEVPVPFTQVHTGLGTVISFRSSSLRQHVQGQTEATTGIKRPAPGSGSFHFSINTAKARVGERPRSSSFLGVLGHTGGKVKTGGEVEDVSLPSSMDQRKKKLQIEENIKIRDVKPKGASAAVEGPREHGGLHKSSVLPWDRGDSLKKEDSVTSKSVTTNTGALEGVEVGESQEVVEEAAEAEDVQGEEGKTTFGIKLRSTSLSKKMRSDADAAYSDFKMKQRPEIGSLSPPNVPYNIPSKSVLAEEQLKRKRQEIGNNASYISKKLPPNIPCTPTTSGEFRQTDGTPAPSDSTIPVKHTPLPASDPHAISTNVQTNFSNPKEVETVPTAPQEAQPASQAAPSEVSWMSMAMEKTRSLQQLLTSRLPRDFTTAARPQTQSQPENQEQTVSRSRKVTQSEALIGTQIQPVETQQSSTQLQAVIQQSSDTATPTTMQSGSQTQTTKSSLMPTTVPMQEKPSVLSTNQPHTSREPKQTSGPPLNTNITQSDALSSPQGGNTPQFAQESAAQSLAQHALSLGQQSKFQQPSSNRSLHSANQLKSTTSVLTSVSNSASTPAPPPVFALGKGERGAAIQGKDGPSLSERRAVFGGSVGEKAALLERQAELGTPSGTKVDLRKTQTETQAPAESPSLANTTPLIKDTKQGGRPGVKPAESSPTKIPDRPVNREDRWLRKNMTSSSSPSSSPTLQSPVQSMSDSSKPSWMELAKRKSMAWSDKNMD